MNCPNIYSEDWKVLVAEEGEVSARNLYIKNGYDIPKLTDIDKLKGDLLEKPIDYIKSKELQQLIDIKSKAYFTMNTRLKIYKNKLSAGDSNLEEIISDLEESIEAFSDVDIKNNITTILDNTGFTVNSLLKKVDSELGLSLKGLNNAKDITNSFEIIDDLLIYLNGNTEIDSEFKTKTINNINDLRGKIERLNAVYNKEIKKKIASEFKNISSIKRFERKSQLENEYKLNNPFDKTNLSRVDYNTKMDDWVNSKLLLENASILQSEEEYIYDLLSTAPGDITSFAANIIDPRNITQDQLIQVMVNLLDKASFDTNLEFQKTKEEFMIKFNEFSKGKTSDLITDQLELYGDILEKDSNGNPTGYYTRPMSKEYYDAWEKTLELVESLDSDSDKTMAFKIFFNKYRPSSKKNKKTKFDLDNPDGVDPEYYSEQYKKLLTDPEKLDYYNYLINFNKQSDSLIEGSGRKLKYKLPGITAKGNEILKREGVVGSVKRWYKDNTELQADDVNYKQENQEEKFNDLKSEDNNSIRVLGTQGGKAYHTIDIPFRRKVDLSDQSFDLAGMSLSNRYGSLNYSNKNKIKDLLELTRDMMGERDVELRDNKSSKKIVQFIKSAKNILGTSEEEIEEVEQSIKTDGKSSNSYKLMTSIIEDRLYGLGNIPGGDLMFGISKDKFANLAMKISANNFLIGNVAGGFANVLQGKVMNFLEGVGGYNYNTKNLRHGEAKYMSDTKQNVSDIGSTTTKSKTNRLIEALLGDSVDFNGFANDLTKDNKVKNLVSFKSLHSVNSLAEHYIQGTLMYSYLDTIKVKNDLGEWVDSQGNKVSSESEAASLDEVITIDNSQLTINPIFKVNGFENAKDINDILFPISSKLKEIVKDLQGNYSAENKAMIQRYWYGKLLFFMRKYLVPATQRRWKGWDTKSIKKEDIPLHLRGFSESLKNEKEGTYTTLTRFLSEVIKSKDKLTLELMSTDWNNLNDYERSNIRSAVWEMGLMIAALVGSSLLANLAEENDDDETIFMFAYLSRRLWGELMFFTPLSLVSGESARLLESPTATLSTMKTFGMTLDSMLNDAINLELNTYNSGKHKGESKTWVYLNKLLNPINKNFVDRDYKDLYNFQINQTY